MKVLLEKPVSWLASERDGERNRLMYDNLRKALLRLGAEVSEINTYYGNDFMERSAPPNHILISYHSVGDAPRVWRLKETSIPFFYNIDRLGYSGWSELAVEREKHESVVSARSEPEARRFCERISSWLVQNNFSKYAQNDRPVSMDEAFVLLPMQIRSDAVAVHNQIDPLDVLHEAGRLCRKYGKKLLVKRHPYCSSRRVAAHLAWITTLNSQVYSTTASVTSLLPACNAVLVGNSGVGFEALVYGKPVFSFAKSEYEMATYQIRNRQDLQTVFIDSPVVHPNAYKFAHYFLSERCFDARSPEDISEKLTNILS